MRTTRYAALALVALLTLSACSKQPASQPATGAAGANDAAATPAAGSGGAASTPAVLRSQAEALMGKGDYPAAIERWTALAAVEPTAANWNDLSFAYLQAEQWPAAIDAGQKALKLEPKLPAALYNVGMAYLGSGDACNATTYLSQAASAQPDRYEPLMGLARAGMALNDYAHAAAYARQAAKVGAGQADFSTLLAAIERMRQGNPPADLTKASEATLADGDATLYVYQERQVKTCNGPAYTLYLVSKDGKSARLPIGPVRMSGEGKLQLKLYRESLPGGVTGYWLEAPDHWVYVSSFSDWRLFTNKDGQLNQVRFTKGENPPQDFLQSHERPTVSGSHITQWYYNTANGATTLIIQSELQPDLATAAVVESTEQAAGVVTAVNTESISIRVRPDNRGGGVPQDYVMIGSLKEDVQVLQGGQPVPLSTVKLGMMVRLSKSTQRTVVEVLSQPGK